MSAPLTSSEMDVRDLDGFMLNVERLLASELWALTRHNPAAFRGAVGLWARAWKQIPAASLPDDDAVIAAFADMPVAVFRKNKALVMRGFELCDDGRYYHRVLAAEVQKIWPSVAKKRRDREADNERLKQWREKQRAERETGKETLSETAYETRFTTPKKRVANGVDTDTDRDRDIKSKNPSLRSVSGGSEAQKLNEKPPRSSPKPIDSKAFKEFYDAFPLKKSRGAALKAWPAALRKATETELIDGAKRYAKLREGEDHRYTKHPATWLNQECWADDLPSTPSVLATPENDMNSRRLPPREPRETDERYQVRCFRLKGFWLSIWGAPPDSPDCCMPRSVLEEFGYGERVRTATAVVEGALH